jgi:hypothetical protein
MAMLGDSDRRSATIGYVVFTQPHKVFPIYNMQHDPFRSSIH